MYIYINIELCSEDMSRMPKLEVNKPTETRVYADVSLDFRPHPLTGDLPMVLNENAIKQAVSNLIQFNPHDKPFKPTISSGISALLFEPMTQKTAIGLESRIRFVLTQYEPRVSVSSIDVIADPVRNGYEVVLVYSINNLMNPVEQKIFLERIR